VVLTQRIGGRAATPRFPPPRIVEEHTESFIVRDATVLFSISTRSRSAALMAANFAKLPELLRRKADSS